MMRNLGLGLCVFFLLAGRVHAQAAASRQNIANAQGLSALANAREAARAKYKAERFGEKPALSEAELTSIDEEKAKLPDHLAKLVDRMLAGERPTQLVPNDLVGLLQVGDFGPYEAIYHVGEIIDGETAVCHFARHVGMRAVPDYDQRFILRGVKTDSLVVDRWSSFKMDFVLVRKSDDYPDLPIEKGTLAIEVIGEQDLLQLASTIYPPKDAKGKPVRSKRAATAAATPVQEPRDWTSADGRFSVVATFRGMNAAGVKLKKADGTEITVPLDSLSEADREWIEDRRK